MRYASFGIVSRGTLRTEDLLQAFVDELDYQVKRQPRSVKRAPYRKTVHHARALQRLLAHPTRGDSWREIAAECVNDLQDALRAFAPPWGFFGPHATDADDVGFWLADGEAAAAMLHGTVRHTTDCTANG